MQVSNPGQLSSYDGSQHPKALNGLDEVPWNKLKHAYGSAGNVPNLLRALVSPDEKKREDALYSLYGNIFHQETRYKASAYAVPFLIRLAQDTTTPDRSEIITLLVHLAIGYDESYLPFGITPQILTRFHPYETAVYRAVEDHIPALIELTGDEHVEVRLQAVYCLGWFPEKAAEIIPALRTYIRNASDAREVANAAMALGILCRAHEAHQEDKELLISFLSEEKPLLLRQRAAISLGILYGSELPQEALHLLIGLLSNETGAIPEADHLPWNEGDISGFASVLLACIGTQHQAVITEALCKALEHTDPFSSVMITEALLHLLFQDTRRSAGDTQTVQQFNPLQKKALHTIAEYGGWQVRGMSFANYGLTVSRYGFPGTQEKLRTFLADDDGP